jgi:hypothetical protein
MTKHQNIDEDLAESLFMSVANLLFETAKKNWGGK